MLEQGQGEAPVYFLVTLLYLGTYTLLSSFLQDKNFPIHRTAVAILIGIAVGLILSFAAPDTYSQIAKLNQVIVFTVLFPPMIFAQGYTLHKSVLFKNGKYIVLFGIIGTFASFLISWGLIYEANSLNLVVNLNDIHNVRTLSDWQILLLAACLCSIDTTASQQSVSQFKYPRLYSIIFGEDVVKDAVTIVLFTSILNLQSNESPDKLVIYWYTFFQVLLNFIILILGSVIAGAFSSVLAIYLSKKMRFMAKDKGVTQTGFLFIIGFITYIFTQLLGFSGSISLLLYGILLNHYNFYNMSEESHRSSTNTFTILSNMSQGLLFLIMGIMVCQGQWQSPDSDSDNITHSYVFFAVVMIILCFARFFNIYVLGWLSRKLFNKKLNIHNQQLHIIFLSGLVRGAVPFVLFSSVTFTQDSRYSKNQGIVLKTTIIFIITFTSVVINSIIPCFFKKRLIKLVHIEKQQLLLLKQKQEAPVKSPGKLKMLQEKYIKPFLIYDYEVRKQDIMQKKRKRQKQAQEEALAQFNEQELLSLDDEGRDSIQ